VYLDRIAAQVKAKLDREQIPSDSDQLFHIYAVLVMGRGTATTDEEVHAAWSSWIAAGDPAHESLRPFAELPADVQAMDRAYRDAIRAVARERDRLDAALFPVRSPVGASSGELLDLYQLMVQSSESLVARRQSVNTFFVTINGALLTAIGLVIRSSGGESVAALGLMAIGVAGLLFCVAWHSLIKSFGQLNAGKFKVIHRLEDHLAARIYAAEWEALERGENPDVYRSFTSREIWVPRVAIAIYLVVIGASGTFAAGLWALSR
jgi:hypothetical protein